MSELLSLPSWECGLKSTGKFINVSHKSVAPFVGVWIEIRGLTPCSADKTSRSLRGSVD